MTVHADEAFFVGYGKQDSGRDVMLSIVPLS